MYLPSWPKSSSLRVFLRRNLDGLNHFQDVVLWRVSEDEQLRDLVESLEGQLEHELPRHSTNFSVVERYLIV